MGKTENTDRFVNAMVSGAIKEFVDERIIEDYNTDGDLVERTINRKRIQVILPR